MGYEGTPPIKSSKEVGMKKGQGTPEARKIAMRTWLEFGGKNIKGMLERLDPEKMRLKAKEILEQEFGIRMD